jgi:transcriptional regulator with XRE-family HTH domain
MPAKALDIDPRMEAAIPRLRARMAERGHTQKDVEAATGVGQSQISKFLSGQRRRLTPDIERLFQYAGIGMPVPEAPAAELARLSRTVRRLVGNNTRRAVLLTRVIESLGPALALLDAAELPPEEVTP